MKKWPILILLLSLFACNQTIEQEDTAAATPPEVEWQVLFNGEDLSGWTPKFAGSPLGENYKNTFQVEEGILKVSYDEYDTFNQEFGHLFYEKPFSHYILRVEYRFVGEQVPNGPGWAFKNSGAMLHCQDPKTMTVAQDFPVCIEAQFLGGDGISPRSTGNLCTPGTNVFLADTLTTNHCINSTSPTFATEDWVQMDMIVYGDSLIHHVVEGDTVLTYTKMQIGDNGNAPNEGAPVGSGYISLQAESHPVHFRKVELKELK